MGSNRWYTNGPSVPSSMVETCGKMSGRLHLCCVLRAAANTQHANRHRLFFESPILLVQEEGIVMTIDEEELRRIFTSASLGQTAYRTWAQQARRERRFNIARLLDALGASKQARAEHAFRQLGEAGLTT